MWKKKHIQSLIVTFYAIALIAQMLRHLTCPVGVCTGLCVMELCKENILTL
jgi:hypothetical protein